MKIQYNTDKNIEGIKRQEEYFTTQISDELARYQPYLTRVEVHLSDENGKKEGYNNFQCKLEGRIKGKQPITVSSQENSIELAVSGAIKKLKNSLDSMLG